MPTSTSEAIYHLKNKIQNILLLDDNSYSLNVELESDLSSIPLTFGFYLRQNNAETTYKNICDSISKFNKQVSKELMDLGYTIKYKPFSHKDLNRDFQKQEIRGGGAYRVQLCNLVCSKTNLRIQLNNIKKEISSLKKNPGYISGAMIGSEDSEERIFVDLSGHISECENSLIAKEALALNYNRMLNGLDFVGGYRGEYLYSNKPQRQTINFVSEFGVDFEYLSQRYKFDINFSEDTPKVIITQNRNDVTHKFLRSNELGVELHTLTDVKIKKYVRALLPRAAKYSEFQIRSTLISVTPANYARFKNVAITMERDREVSAIIIKQNGIELLPVSGRLISSETIEHYNRLFDSNPDLVNEMKSCSKEYYRYFALKVLGINSYNVKNMYFY